MIDKVLREKILKNYILKEEKIFVANIIDKINKCFVTSTLVFTNFLDINEQKIVTCILNKVNMKYLKFSPNKNCERSVIAFIPEYYFNIDNSIFSEYVCCIKIISSTNSKLTHKDYMGAIYSLGLKRELIGDIFCNESFAYLFLMASSYQYVTDNLCKVSNQNVRLERLELADRQVSGFDLNLVCKQVIVASLRVDVLLSNIYSASRSEVKSKILTGDLYVNSCNVTNTSYEIKQDDIVSFKRCGKLKVGQVIKKTKNDNLVLEIYKYS